MDQFSDISNPFHADNPFVYPWKCQRTSGLLAFSEATKMKYWTELGQSEYWVKVSNVTRNRNSRKVLIELPNTFFRHNLSSIEVTTCIIHLNCFCVFLECCRQTIIYSGLKC